MAKTLVKFLLFVSCCLTSYQGKGNESFRFTMDLSTARRYAVRFIKTSGILEIKVVPAMSREFDTTKFYNPKLVNRVILTEVDSEVIVSIELKNKRSYWFVSHQENPWRIIVDIWNSRQTESLEKPIDWEWQKPTQSSNISSESLNPTNLSQTKTNENKENQSIKLELASIAPTTNKSDITKKLKIPIYYGRLLALSQSDENKLNNLESNVGKTIGTELEWGALKEHVRATFDMGKDVSTLTRRLASLSETKFKDDPNLLWISGENSYINEKFELSKDYYRSLLLNHPENSHSLTALLRLTDIDVITKNSSEDLTENEIDTYRKIALNNLTPKYAKIAAALRIILPKIEKNVHNVKLFLPIIDECVNMNIVPIETRKNCFYVRTRFHIENMDIIGADSEVQKFMKFSQNDPRSDLLNNLISQSVKKYIEDVENKKDWVSWVNFEKQARPGLLDFTLKNSKYLKMRSQAFLENGNKREASSLLSLYADNEDSINDKISARIISAKLLFELNDKKRAELILKNILNERNKDEKIVLSNDSQVNLKVLTLPPFKSPTAFLLLINEMKNNKFNENNLNSLFEYIKLSKNKNDSDWLYAKVIAFPAKNAEEISKIENLALKRADSLRDSNRLRESADMFLAVSKLNGGEKRAEAAYKAGLVYARIGVLEKARESWQVAASDVKDKRYSLLASERLERMK